MALSYVWSWALESIVDSSTIFFHLPADQMSQSPVGKAVPTDTKTKEGRGVATKGLFLILKFKTANVGF